MTRRSALLTGVAFVLALLIAPFAVRFAQLVHYARHRRAAAEIVESLEKRRPADVTQKTWDDATTWASIAYHNVCFSDEHVQLAELKRFTADLEQQCAGHVDLNTIDWMWKRLAETGAHGTQYVARFEPGYRELVYGEISPPVPDEATP